MAMSRLSMTITAPIVLISALAIGLTVFLDIGKLDRTLAELEHSRLNFTLNNLRENLETGLDLGLPVKGLGNAQAAIDQEARRDADIVSIQVLDSQGRAVFNAGGGGDLAVTTLRTGLSNNLGVRVGAIELRYARRGHDNFIGAIGRQLMLAALGVGLATSLIAVAGIRLWVRRIQRTLDTIASTLEPADGAAAAAAAPRKPDTGAAELARQVNHSTRSALLELDLAGREITSADVAGAPQ